MSDDQEVLATAGGLYGQRHGMLYMVYECFHRKVKVGASELDEHPFPCHNP